MLPLETRNEITKLIKREVVPAMGCTEPVAVSLCTAKAVEILGCVPQNINVKLSPNVLKNAMGVGIPGTGMVGLPIAVALGALVGRSEYSLEVLKDTTPQAVEQGKRMIEEKRINVSLKGVTQPCDYLLGACLSERGEHSGDLFGKAVGVDAVNGAQIDCLHRLFIGAKLQRAAAQLQSNIVVGLDAGEFLCDVEHLNNVLRRVIHMLPPLFLS